MPDNIKNYFIPQTIEEALEFMDKYEEHIILSGGTVVSQLSKQNIDTIIDISSIGYSQITEDKKGLHIGACAIIDQLCRDSIVKSYCSGIISYAASRFSNRIIRNMATIGGNILAPYYWVDFPGIMVALDSIYYFRNKKSTIQISSREFHSKNFRKNIKGAILTEILVPSYMKDRVGFFIKFNRLKSDISLCNIILIAKDNSGFSDVRFVIGATGHRDYRVPEIEKLIEKKEVESNDISAIIRRLRFVSDLRADKEYRYHVATVMTKRLLSKILSQNKN